MFNLDDITDEHNKKHNKKCPYTPNHPYKMLITICSGSGKTKALFDLIKKQIVTILLIGFICMLNA